MNGTAPREDIRRERRRALVALALLVPVPSLGAAAALWVWPGPAGQAVYLASKAWLLLFPVAWLRWVERARLRPRPATRRGLVEGMLQGALIAATIAGAWLLFGRDLVDTDAARRTLHAAGLTTAGRFAAVAIGLSFANSLVEEYVWRFFVTSRWERLVRPAAAVLLSAGCFTIHHAVALSAQLPWLPTLLASLGTFAGGVLWAWLFTRHGSIWPGWASHVLADLAVMGIGADILFGTP